MKKGTPLYENIYIGGFIYALGVISGRKGHEETEAFSLIQQTPDDKIIADLFARWKGANFIIEFKRKRNDIKSELKKPLKRKLLDIIWDRNNPNFKKNLSFLNKCHFICFADDMDSRTTLNFLPYAHVSKFASGQIVEEMVLTEFIEQVILRKIGVSLKALQAYFKFLKDIFESSFTSVGGLIVNIDVNGNPNLVRFDDLSILEQSLQHAFEKSIERSLDRGPSLSM